jgi:acetylornithine deacetylase/succinyl-diaminopimelate desuccinylase-like protein
MTAATRTRAAKGAGGATSGGAGPLSLEALLSFAESVRADYEQDLRELVEIPTVSVDPSRASDVARGAEAAAALLRRLGATASVEATGGHPLVVGELAGGDHAPTVTVYNHLDVQPAAREDGWRTDPFRMVQQGDRYIGRGTTDDKGPALAALYGALAARRAGVPLNVRFLWELEEESSSAYFESAIRKLAPRLATDLVIISDGLWVSRRRPTCLSALRGWLGLELALETGRGEAHSGIVGGLARNPLAELMQVVSELHDARTGHVKVPGFYDDVEPLTRREREEFRRSGFSLASLRAGTGIRRLRTEDSAEAMRRIWALPTFEVHGVVGGYTGPGLKSIVPGRAEIKASFRLVPGQRPEHVGALVERFIRKRNRDVVVRCDAGALPYRADVSGPLAAALRRAMAAAFGKEPKFVRGGGTIGAVATMERVLGAPVLFLDLSLPEHGYHAANEYFEWGQASRGMVAFARFFGELAGPDGALAAVRESHGATLRRRRRRT